MNNKKYLNLDKLITEDVIKTFEDIVTGPVKTDENSYEYKIDTPPGCTKMTFQEVYDMVQECWWETEDRKDGAVIYTGIEGNINFLEQLVKQTGGTFTEQNREDLRQELIKSKQTIFKL